MLKTTLSQSSEFLLNEGVSEAKSCDCKGGKNWWVGIFIVAFKKDFSFQELEVKILYLKEECTKSINFTTFCNDQNSQFLTWITTKYQKFILFFSLLVQKKFIASISLVLSAVSLLMRGERKKVKDVRALYVTWQAFFPYPNHCKLFLSLLCD